MEQNSAKKEGDLARYMQIFQKFFPEISVPLDFSPGIFGLTVDISGIQQFSHFGQLFQKNVSHCFSLFEISERLGKCAISALMMGLITA